MHSFDRLRGFGLALVPFAPYVIRRIGDRADDRIASDHDRQRAVLDPHGAAPSAAAVAVADVFAVPDAHAWCIEFGGRSVPWPNHFALDAHADTTFGVGDDLAERMHSASTIWPGKPDSARRSASTIPPLM